VVAKKNYGYSFFAIFLGVEQTNAFDHFHQLANQMAKTKIIRNFVAIKFKVTAKGKI